MNAERQLSLISDELQAVQMTALKLFPPKNWQDLTSCLKFSGKIPVMVVCDCMLVSYMYFSNKQNLSLDSPAYQITVLKPSQRWM